MSKSSDKEMRLHEGELNVMELLFHPTSDRL